jgi:hypothetical protein
VHQTRQKGPSGDQVWLGVVDAVECGLVDGGWAAGLVVVLPVFLHVVVFDCASRAVLFFFFIFFVRVLEDVFAFVRSILNGARCYLFIEGSDLAR